MRFQEGFLKDMSSEPRKVRNLKGRHSRGLGSSMVWLGASRSNLAWQSMTAGAFV